MSEAFQVFSLCWFWQQTAACYLLRTSKTKPHGSQVGADLRFLDTSLHRDAAKPDHTRIEDGESRRTTQRQNLITNLITVGSGAGCGD